MAIVCLAVPARDAEAILILCDETEPASKARIATPAEVAAYRLSTSRAGAAPTMMREAALHGVGLA